MTLQLLVILCPLISFSICALFGRFLGHRGSMLITTTFLIFNVFLSIFLFLDISLTGHIYAIKLMPWISSGVFHIDWGFFFDNLTVAMLIVVNGVSALVHLYSTEYMAHDPHTSRFMSYLSLFTFFMLILVTGDSFITMFLG